MVNGIETFREKFKDYSDCYTVIGGTACDILMTEADTRISVSGLVRESVERFLDRITEEELALSQIGLSIDKEQGMELIRAIYTSEIG